MSPITSPLTASFAHRPPLAAPTLAETERTRLGSELENYLAPLVAYCDAQPADDDLGLPEFRHGYELRQALDAFVRYETQTEQLLAHYRAALAYAQQQASQQVPSLDAALSLPPVPAPEGNRATDPVYCLGWCRGYRRAQQQYEHLSSLYAQYAVLVPPLGYQPSPLVERVNAHLASPGAQVYAALPLPTRQALSQFDHANLTTREPR